MSTKKRSAKKAPAKTEKVEPVAESVAAEVPSRTEVLYRIVAHVLAYLARQLQVYTKEHDELGINASTATGHLVILLGEAAGLDKTEMQERTASLIKEVFGGEKCVECDLVTRIMCYENGELNEDQTVALFQELLDTGTINHLQGSYGGMMAAMIKDGLVKVKG